MPLGCATGILMHNMFHKTCMGDHSFSLNSGIVISVICFETQQTVYCQMMRDILVTNEWMHGISALLHGNNYIALKYSGRILLI